MRLRAVKPVGAGARYWSAKNRMSSAGLSIGHLEGKAVSMGKPSAPLSREERLAERLRENLRRRKAQARAMEAMAADTLPKADTPR
jgi:hypothetical protein